MHKSKTQFLLYTNNTNHTINTNDTNGTNEKIDTIYITNS